MFSVHITPEKFKNATITVHFRLFSEKTSGTEISSLIIVTSSFPRKSVFKMFPSALKHKVGVFKFLRFEKRLRKAPFSWRIRVDDRNKAAFSNFSGVKWTGPKCKTINVCFDFFKMKFKIEDYFCTSQWLCGSRGSGSKAKVRMGTVLLADLQRDHF